VIHEVVAQEIEPEHRAILLEPGGLIDQIAAASGAPFDRHTVRSITVRASATKDGYRYLPTVDDNEQPASQRIDVPYEEQVFLYLQALGSSYLFPIDVDSIGFPVDISVRGDNKPTDVIIALDPRDIACLRTPVLGTLEMARAAVVEVEEGRRAPRMDGPYF